MSSNSAILFGRRKNSGDDGTDKRRGSGGSGQRRGSNKEETDSLNSDVQSLRAAIREVENSPEHQAEKQALEEARHELREVRQYDKPVHSGLSVAQRLHIKEQKKKKLNKGQTDFRETLLRTPNQKGTLNGDDRSWEYNSRRESLDNITLDDGVDMLYTKRDMRRALSPSRTYREELFYHEPPEPEKLFEYEGHVTKMKIPTNNAVRDFGKYRSSQLWKQRMEEFLVNEHVGSKADDKELFQEKNGAGGEHFILIDGKPSNPNKIIHSSDLTTLRVTNLLETHELPGYMTQRISCNPSETMPRRIKGCFDDTWTETRAPVGPG